MRLIHELMAKYPGLAKDATRSPRAAIRLFCLECMGGNSAEVAKCTCTPESILPCPLYRYRFRHIPNNPDNPQVIGVEKTIQGEPPAHEPNLAAKIDSSGPGEPTAALVGKI